MSNSRCQEEGHVSTENKADDKEEKTSPTHAYKKLFQNAVNKNKIIHKIQVLQEEKDEVVEQELSRAHEGAQGFKERFQKARPNSFCDPVDMVPAGDMPHLQQHSQQSHSHLHRTGSGKLLTAKNVEMINKHMEDLEKSTPQADGMDVD